MTLDPRLNHDLAAAFSRLESGGRPEYTDELLARIGRVRQRPSWRFREWWLPEALTPGLGRFGSVRWRLIIVVALVALALILVGIESGVGHPRPRLAPFGPARNGAIVYATGGDIFAGDATKGTVGSLVPGPAYDFRPGYSPDGSTVAFLRRVNAASAGKTDIVVARADGGQPSVITTVPLAAEPAWWQWAPDSRSIVVMMSGSRNTSYAIYDTSRPGPPKVVTPVVPVDPPLAFQPPTGERVVVRGYVGSRIGLYTMGIDGSRLTPVIAPFVSLNDQIDLVDPAWSPDGAKIAVQRVIGDGSGTGLYVMNADGGASRRVDGGAGDAAAGWAVWSPDGTKIAFQWASGAQDSNGYFLYWWAVATLGDGTIVKTGPMLAYNTVATWSPDGTTILVLNETAGHPQLVLDPGGGSQRTLPWSAVGGDWDRLAP